MDLDTLWVTEPRRAVHDDWSLDAGDDGKSVSINTKRFIPADLRFTLYGAEPGER